MQIFKKFINLFKYRPVIQMSDTPVLSTPYCDDQGNTLDEEFYTTKYKLDIELKKKIVNLVLQNDFRAFEEYLKWKVNKKAHAMVKTDSDSVRHDTAIEINTIAEITADLAVFWEEVNRLEEQDAIKFLKKDETTISKKL